MLDLTSFEAFSSLKTPFYYYDAALLKRTISYVSKMSRKYGIEVHYAIKANPEERILRMISSSGLGADCVSGNEIVRAIRCGFKPSSILF
ncbi:MAG: diaminopimelate decarboxylase, partial [Bacteroidales bacterium]|nr:diaminopimelate decarboxylase [Bacteroidales bacterium]